MAGALLPEKFDRLPDGLKRVVTAQIEQRQRRGAVIDLVRLAGNVQRV